MAQVDLFRKSVETRKTVLKLIHHAKTGHTGGALSSTDIMVSLYYKIMNIDPKNPNMEDRDRFILSKGHSVEPLWTILADLGFYPEEDLWTFSSFGSKLIGHPNNKMPGVEMNTGSLGHGLSVGSGLALAAKKMNKSYRTFVLMGDGEQAEGSVWEAAMFAAHYKLDNLVAIIDRNRLQISGSTEEVMALDPLDEKWEAFGWEVVQVDGNNLDQLVSALDSSQVVTGKPKLILANTTKGKGVSFIENQADWHHHVPTDDQLAQAQEELDQQLTEVCCE